MNVSKTIKIIGGVLGGIFGALLLGLLIWRLKGKEYFRHRLYTSKRGQDIKLSQIK